MLLKRNGVTRLVFIFKNIVIKIPNFTCQWDHFLLGIIANINENRCYKWHEHNDILCPVKWISWLGFILIMKRADTDRHLKEVYEDGLKFNYSSWVNCGLGGDDKPDNYGYVNDKLVKIDYA